MTITEKEKNKSEEINIAFHGHGYKSSLKLKHYKTINITKEMYKENKKVTNYMILIQSYL